MGKRVIGREFIPEPEGSPWRCSVCGERISGFYKRYYQTPLRAEPCGHVNPDGLTIIAAPSAPAEVPDD